VLAEKKKRGRRRGGHLPWSATLFLADSIRAERAMSVAILKPFNHKKKKTDE
jgi:hypothetical protein